MRRSWLLRCQRRSAARISSSRLMGPAGLGRSWPGGSLRWRTVSWCSQRSDIIGGLRSAHARPAPPANFPTRIHQRWTRLAKESAGRKVQGRNGACLPTVSLPRVVNAFPLQYIDYAECYPSHLFADLRGQTNGTQPRACVVRHQPTARSRRILVSCQQLCVRPHGVQADLANVDLGPIAYADGLHRIEISVSLPGNWAALKQTYNDARRPA